MNYVIYGRDGSIKKKNFTDFIQKGNNNVNSIFIGIEGLNYNSWTANVFFTLPNGDIPDPETITPIQDEETIDNVTYQGWKVSIPASVTVFEGIVKFSVSAETLDNRVLFTFNANLVINPSSVIPNETKITLSQYNALLALVNSKNAISTAIYVVSDIEATDLSTFLEGQIFYDLKTSTFYTRNEQNFLILYDRHTGLLGRNNTIPRIHLTDAVTQETYDPILAELNGIFFTFIVKVNNEDFVVAYRSSGVGALRIRDLTYYYADDLTIKLTALCSSTYKQDVIRDGNLKSKVYPFFNVVSIASSPTTISGADLELITNNPNTKVFYAGKYYDRHNVNGSAQPVFTNIDVAVSDNDIVITNSQIVYDSDAHSLTAGEIVTTTINKSQLESLFAQKADKADTYTKSEVQAIINTINERNYEKVNTTTYPTLNDFLESTGDSGVLYLYPVDVADLSKGYQQYIWESNEWLYLGDTVLDLSNYYTKAQVYNKTEVNNLLDTKANVDSVYTKSNTYSKTEVDTFLNEKANDDDVVHKTGNETITGTKKFEGSVNLGNFVATSCNSDLRPLYDDLRSLGTATYRWKNLYTSGSWKDGTNSLSLQDLVDWQTSVNEKLAELIEAVEFESTLSYSFLQWSAIPIGISTYPIIFEGGMETLNVKGNSCVVNQLTSIDTFTTTQPANAVSNNTINYDENHKYLIVFDYEIADSYSTTYFLYGVWDSSRTLYKRSSSLTPTSAKGKYLGFASLTQGSLTDFNNVSVIIQCLGTFTSCKVDNAQLFDLTLMGLDNLTTVDEVRSALLQRGINIDEYNAYDEGSIKDSKPAELTIHHFNLWDEETVVGIIGSTGAIGAQDGLRSANYCPCEPSTTYYGANPSNHTTLHICWYDKDKNFIQRDSINKTTVTSPANARYFMLSMYAYGETYLNDICINISNAVLNGTYKPYQAPSVYPLSLPKLRGIGTAHDDKDKVRINFKIISGSEVEDVTNVYTNVKFYRVAKPTDYVGYGATSVKALGTMIANKFVAVDVSGTGFDSTSNIYAVSSQAVSNYLWFGFPVGTTLEQAQAYIDGTVIAYQLSTPVNRNALGVVNLGTLDWKRSGSGLFYVNYLDLAKAPSSDAVVAILMCPLYQSTYRNNASNIDKSISLSTEKSLVINDSAYTDKDVFKAAMNGVYLSYELATPTDNPISLPRTPIEKGDSIEITYDLTDNCGSDFDFEVLTSKIKEA